MAKRKIIEINRDLCDGCGLCTTACAEGALALDAENKAVLVRELFCDGMGACLDVCPTRALEIIEREGDAYNPRAAYEHVLKTRGEADASKVHGVQVEIGKGLQSGCPGSAARDIPAADNGGEAGGVRASSELRQWPIQLHLVSPFAPYFQDAELLVAADCTAFALGGFHQDLLRGKKLVIACPKLDDTSGYVEKLTDILKLNAVRSLSVAVMTVPCCAGLFQMVSKAVAASGTHLEINKIVIGLDGTIQG